MRLLDSSPKVDIISHEEYILSKDNRGSYGDNIGRLSFLFLNGSLSIGKDEEIFEN